MCSICDGAGTSHRCPVCGPEPKVDICTNCNGVGYFYLAENVITGEWIDVSEKGYYDLPRSEQEALEKGIEFFQADKDMCNECNGDGFVPNYDDEW